MCPLPQTFNIMQRYVITFTKCLVYGIPFFKSVSLNLYENSTNNMKSRVTEQCRFCNINCVLVVDTSVYAAFFGRREVKVKWSRYAP
jgi:hypothetical protein